MSLDACADLVRRGDPDRYQALLAAAPVYRPAMVVLYAFNLELARAPYVTAEPLIAEMRLQWWQNVVESGEVLAHEVAGPLKRLMIDKALEPDLLTPMIVARHWDITGEPFADQHALEAHLNSASGALIWATALANGAEPSDEPGLRAFGAASGLAQWLRSVPELIAHGLAPLPDPSPAAISLLAHEGLGWLNAARRQNLSAPARAAMLAGWQTRALLHRALREPEKVSAGMLHLSEFSRRGRLAWQALTGRF